MEARRRDALPIEPAPHRFDHRWGSAKIDIDGAAVQVRGIDVRGHIPFAPVRARLSGNVSSISLFDGLPITEIDGLPASASRLL